MLVESCVADICQDGQAPSPYILYCFDAQFEGRVIGIVWNKGAHQRVSSIAERKLNRRHRFKVLIGPFITVVRAE